MRAAYFFDRKDDDDEERVGHGEEHPDVDHLDVASARQISRYPDEAEKYESKNYPEVSRIFTMW